MALCLQETAVLYKLWTAFLNHDFKGSQSQMILTCIFNLRFWKHNPLIPNRCFNSVTLILKVIKTERNQVPGHCLFTFHRSTEMDWLNLTKVVDGLFKSQLVTKTTLTVYLMRSWMFFNISWRQSRKYVADIALHLQMQVRVCLGRYRDGVCHMKRVWSLSDSMVSLRVNQNIS